ncbi:hypothetical protein ACE01N_04480 [Saccharicrinis sp. FJH2]|uniref:hypothetical protein n=1 Tax=Saccharicrinis sp. FJH65 TaxID=3344659 RepID=UPI0035F2FE27
MIRKNYLFLFFAVVIFSACRHGKNSNELQNAFAANGSVDVCLQRMSDISKPVYDVAVLVDTAMAPSKVYLDSLYMNGYAYREISSVDLAKAKVSNQTIKIDSQVYHLLYANAVSDFATYKRIVKDGGVISYDVPDSPIENLPLNDFRTIKFGGGGIVSGEQPNKVLGMMKVEPQFKYPADLNLEWNQYHYKGIDFFVVTNHSDDDIEFKGTFGTLAGAPEMWDPVTKQQYAVDDYWQVKGAVTFDIKEKPGQTLIYVFGTNADRDKMKEYKL